MDGLDFEREHYCFELGRKDSLNSNMSIPLGILTASFGVFAYYFNKVTSFASGFGCFLFSLLLIIMFFALIYATYNLIKSYWGLKYKYIPTSSELNIYWNNLTQYYQTYPDIGTPEEKYEETLMKYFSEANENNTKNNDYRSKYLHNANTTILAILALAAILIVPLQYKSVLAKVNYVSSKFIQKEVNRDEPRSKTTTTSPATTTNKNYPRGSKTTKPQNTQEMTPGYNK